MSSLKKRIYGNLLVLVVVYGVCVSLYTYLFTMSAMLGQPLFGVGVGASDPALLDARAAGLPQMAPLATGRGRIAVVSSEATKAYLIGNGGNYETLLKAWTLPLQRSGFDVKTVNEGQLEKALKKTDVVALPLAIAISPQTVERLTQFLNDGGGLIASGPVGMRDGAGEWAGPKIMKELLGLEFKGEDDSGESLYFAFPGDHFLTAGLPAGARMELARWGRPTLAVPLSKAAVGVGGLTDWHLAPLGHKALGGEQPPAAILNQRGLGRLVWFSVDPSGVGTSYRDSEIMRAIMANAVHWAGRQPLASISTWPQAKKGAALLALDTETQFQNVDQVAALYKRRGVRGTFFMVSDLAAKHPDSVRRAAAVGEIGSHSDDHRPFTKDQSQNDQLERLRKSKTTLETLADIKLSGFRPPEEQMGDATVAALREARYRYVVGDSEYWSAAPETRYSRGWRREDSLIVIPRVARDDYEFLVKRGQQDPAAIAEAMLEDLRKVYELGGLYVFSYHTHLLARPEYLPVVEKVIDKVAGVRPLWLSTAEHVARWWFLREHMEVSVEQITRGRALLRISNVSGDVARDVVVRVWLPEKARKVGLRAEQFSAKLPPIKLVSPGEAQVVVDGLRPESHLVLFLDYVPVAATPPKPTASEGDGSDVAGGEGEQAPAPSPTSNAEKTP